MILQETYRVIVCEPTLFANPLKMVSIAIFVPTRSAACIPHQFNPVNVFVSAVHLAPPQ